MSYIPGNESTSREASEAPLLRWADDTNRERAINAGGYIRAGVAIAGSALGLSVALYSCADNTYRVDCDGSTEEVLIEKGDTLFDIGREFDPESRINALQRVDILKDLNGLESNTIPANGTLTIPSPGSCS